MVYYLGSHCWLWGGVGGEALQKGSAPCGSSTRGGAEGGKPPNDDPAPFWASLWPHDGIRRAPPLASAAVTALAALAFASATALASLGDFGHGLQPARVMDNSVLKSHSNSEVTPKVSLRALSEVEV